MTHSLLWWETKLHETSVQGWYETTCEFILTFTVILYVEPLEISVLINNGNSNQILVGNKPLNGILYVSVVGKISSQLYLIPDCEVA